MKTSLLALVAMAASAADANWPQFRGPSGSGLGSGSPPAEWNVESGKNILWKTAIPGLGHSSPVIWGDKIFLTSAVPATGESQLKVGLYGDVASVKGEPAQSFRVYCLDRKTGKILWERTAASGEPKIMRHPKSTHANPTPPPTANTCWPSSGRKVSSPTTSTAACCGRRISERSSRPSTSCPRRNGALPAPP